MFRFSVSVVLSIMTKNRKLRDLALWSLPLLSGKQGQGKGKGQGHWIMIGMWIKVAGGEGWSTGAQGTAGATAHAAYQSAMVLCFY